MTNTSEDDTLATTEDPRVAYFQPISATTIFILKYYTPLILFLVGCVGNALSYCIMSLPQYRNSTMSIFMRHLAISDTFYLTLVVLQRFIMLKVPILQQPPQANYLCLIFIYSVIYFPIVSPYLCGLMTIDRMIALQFPLKSKSICTIKRAKIATAFVWTIPAILCSGTFFRQYAARYSHLFCPYSLPSSWMKIHSLVENCIDFFIPIILLLCNVIIIIQISRSGMIRRQLTHDESAKASAQQTQVTIMLLTISLTFIVSMIPRGVSIAYFVYNPATTDWLRLVHTTLDEFNFFVFSSNFSLNFYMYLLTCGTMRRELRKVIASKFRRNITRKVDKSETISASL